MGIDALSRVFVVDDLAAAMLILLAGCDAKDVGELVNIGSGADLTIGELACLVKEAVGFRGEIVYDPTKPDGMPRKILDVTLMTRLGWRTSIALDHGLGSTYAWYAGTR